MSIYWSFSAVPFISTVVFRRVKKKKKKNTKLALIPPLSLRVAHLRLQLRQNMRRSPGRPKLHDDRTVTVPSPRGIRTVAAWAPYDFRAETAETAMTARFPFNLRTISVRLCPGQLSKARTRNRTLLVYNVKIVRKIVDK